MRCIENIVVIASALTFIKCTNSLKELIDSNILRTEEVIRNTTNKLFASLKLKRGNPKLNRYLVINKHFASITLQEHETLNKIAKISRANNENNSSIIFMTTINEILSEDNQEIEDNNPNNALNNVVNNEKHDYVLDVIKTFLRGLKEAKELHEINNYDKINEDVLNLIKEANVNTTGNHSANEIVSDEIEFWTPNTRRIYKGERTKIHHFPFMATVQIFNNFQCGGSIIKSDLIITASSCLQLAWNNRFYRENPAFLSVRVGSSFYHGGGEVIPVLEIYFHPNYNPKNLRNNICILRLTRRIRFSWRARRKVRKIAIDRHNFNLPYNTPGIIILGWGAKGRSNVVRDPWQNILSYAFLDVYPLRECQEVYSKEYVTHKNFCAGFMSKGGGACNRDVGAPGIDDGRLMGVVSFGSPVCGAADAPTVFTKLGYYADWIDSIIAQKVPHSRKRTTLLPSSNIQYPIPFKHSSLRSTTFKIPPMTEEKITPIPMKDFGNVLRMFDDDLFKEFLKTVFDSKDNIADYQDMFKAAKQNLDNTTNVITNKNYNKFDSRTEPFPNMNIETITKIINFESESEETATQSNYPNKVLDDTIGIESEEKINVMKMLDNSNFKKIIDGTETESEQIELKGTTESNFKIIETPPIAKTKNESVLTLLYLSKENKDIDRNFETSGEKERKSEEKDGISIDYEHFEDLTRSKHKTKSLYEILPEKELYEILSEVIDDEMRNNKSDV